VQRTQIPVDSYLKLNSSSRYIFEQLLTLENSFGFKTTLARFKMTPRRCGALMSSIPEMRIFRIF
jgi:hypothetical protein